LDNGKDHNNRRLPMTLKEKIVCRLLRKRKKGDLGVKKRRTDFEGGEEDNKMRRQNAATAEFLKSGDVFLPLGGEGIKKTEKN